MQPSFIKKLGLYACKTNIDAQKINGSKFKIFGMVITSFLVENKDGKSCFFEEIFPLANIGRDVDFEMLFLTLSNVEVNFTNWELK